MNIKVNYFDLGLFNGAEISMMLDVFKRLEINNYNVYGFEALPQYFEACSKKFQANNRVQINGLGIGSRKGLFPLYLCTNNPEGHSIYSTKNNVNSSQQVFVPMIVFSEWLEENVLDFRTSFNILKVNIEGAELDLVRDLDAKHLFKYFHVCCGSWDDIKKIKELEPYVSEFYDTLERNNVNVHRFTHYEPWKNADMVSVIKQNLPKFLVGI